MNKVHFMSMTDEWGTPKSVYDKLNQEFDFDSDPCPLEPNMEGLKAEIWGKRVFVNPPYSKISQWVKRGYDHAKKGNLVVMLIPSRTDTRWFHDYVMKSKEIRFIKGRLRFGNAKNCAPFPSCIVIFKPNQPTH